MKANSQIPREQQKKIRCTRKRKVPGLKPSGFSGLLILFRLGSHCKNAKLISHIVNDHQKTPLVQVTIIFQERSAVALRWHTDFHFPPILFKCFDPWPSLFLKEKKFCIHGLAVWVVCCNSITHLRAKQIPKEMTQNSLVFFSCKAQLSFISKWNTIKREGWHWGKRY